MNTRLLAGRSPVAPVSPDWRVVLAPVVAGILMLLLITGDVGGALDRLFAAGSVFVPGCTT